MSLTLELRLEDRHNLSAESLDALGTLKSLSKLVEQTGNLDLILGSNGMYGKNATGNYSLISRATGMTRGFIGKVLRGKTAPSHSTLVKISQATGLSIDKISEYILSQKRQREKEKEKGKAA
jgi:transcriptional regulator with XRE-family HTH domain